MTRAAILVLVPVLAAAGCGDAAPRAAGADRYPRWLERTMVRLSQVAAREVGPDFACAVATPLPRRRVRIFATGADGLARARALRRTLPRPDRVQVRRAPRRLNLEVMARIERALRERVNELRAEVGRDPRWVFILSNPEGNSVWAWRCPPIDISLLPPGEAHPALEQWAAEAVARYGRDRVKILRGVIGPG